MGRVDSFDSAGCVGRTDGVGRVGWVDCADCLGFLGCTDSVGCVGCGGTELGLVSPLLVVDAGVVFGVSELETDVCTLLFLSFGTGFIGSVLGVETVDPLCEESNTLQKYENISTMAKLVQVGNNLFNKPQEKDFLVSPRHSVSFEIKQKNPSTDNEMLYRLSSVTG